MQDFVNILSNFGFPVTIACYLLFRFEKILSDLTKTNNELVIKNTALITEISSLKDTISDLKDSINRGQK